MKVNSRKPMISICCITYNHASYLENTLQGFLNQETQYNYEIIIHDDCSNDGTQEILMKYEREYDFITVMYEEENQFSKGVNIAFDILLPCVQGKYIAICEGDDFWTDNRKLQKQIDFMEKEECCVMTVHNGIKENTVTGEKTVVNPFLQEGYIGEEEMFMAFMNNPPTASFVVRRDALDDYPQFLREAPVVDDVLRLYCFFQGNVYYFDEIMCYRAYMHKDSWNYMLNQDQTLFENYTKRILAFYEAFNEYTSRTYEELIGRVCKKIKRRYFYITGDEIL